jgi:hypothetical protein
MASLQRWPWADGSRAPQVTLETAHTLYYVSDFFQMSGAGNLSERVSKFLHSKVRSGWPLVPVLRSAKAQGMLG